MSLIIRFPRPILTDCPPRSTNPLETGDTLQIRSKSITYDPTSARIGRQTLGRELATVHDYRQRLNQYRMDSSLVLAHQSGPWITVWYALLPRVASKQLIWPLGQVKYVKCIETILTKLLSPRMIMRWPTMHGKQARRTPMTRCSAARSLLPEHASRTENLRPFVRIMNGCPFVRSLRTTNSASGATSRSGSFSTCRCLIPVSMIGT